eukprot:364398-Chlamydomonas_euryale.AAC.6
MGHTFQCTWRTQAQACPYNASTDHSGRPRPARPVHCSYVTHMLAKSPSHHDALPRPVLIHKHVIRRGWPVQANRLGVCVQPCQQLP